MPSRRCSPVGSLVCCARYALAYDVTAFRWMARHSIDVMPPMLHPSHFACATHSSTGLVSVSPRIVHLPCHISRTRFRTTAGRARPAPNAQGMVSTATSLPGDLDEGTEACRESWTDEAGR